jgi:hypothetical protein
MRRNGRMDAALWRDSASGDGRAAIFLFSNTCFMRDLLVAVGDRSLSAVLQSYHVLIPVGQMSGNSIS